MEKEIINIINIISVTVGKILTLSLIAGISALAWRLAIDKDELKK